MKKNLLFVLLACASMTRLFAQEFNQISTGANYSLTSYYTLATGTEVQVPHDSWDLLFTTLGGTDGGIHINESSSSSSINPLPELELYLASTADFAAATSEPDSTFTRLFNDEKSWDLGAVNAPIVASDPFDYGWGLYNLNTHAIEGNRVFIIKLRDGKYKKFIIESLAQRKYTIRYANLDGTEERTAVVDKDANPSSPFAYFSFAKNATLTNEIPNQWDLVFTRYSTPLDDGEGSVLHYNVTGILSGYGVEVAQIEGISPAQVDANTVDSFETDLDVIGHDWKMFDFVAGWVLPADLTYVVKTADNHLYKLVFIDFEGASTGTATMEQTDLGTVSSVEDLSGPFTDVTVFPNPASTELNVVFTLNTAQQDLSLQLYNVLGQQVWQQSTNGNEGLNAKFINLPTLPAGTYWMAVQAGNSVVTRKVSIQK